MSKNLNVEEFILSQDSKNVSRTDPQPVNEKSINSVRKPIAFLFLMFALFSFWQGSGLFHGAGYDQLLAPQEVEELSSVTVGESASGVPLAGKRIDQVDVGQWVLAENPVEEDDLHFGEDVVPSEWRLLELRAPKQDGSYADVRMLRPVAWLEQQWEQKFTPQVASLISFETEDGEQQQAVVLTDELTDPLTGSQLQGPAVYVPQLDEQQLIGQTIYVSVPECGIDGDAHVLSIGTCPNISPRPGPEFQVVTATFHHHAATVLDLYIDDLSSPIGTTANHPFWSEDQQDFVRADELEPGETLRNANGTLAHVQQISTRPGTHDVFNLEVQVKHTYHVAENGVLVHNGSDDCLKIVGLGKNSYLHELGRRVILAIDDGWTKAGLTSARSNHIDEFTWAFRDAVKNSDQIVFNLKGVNVGKAWSEAGELVPLTARPRHLVTEWELRQILGNTELMDKTIFVLDDIRIAGSNYDEVYNFLLGLIK